MDIYSCLMGAGACFLLMLIVEYKRDIEMAERLFCKSCGWESPKANVGMKNECPECGDGLYLRKEDDNLHSSLTWTDKIGHIHVPEGSADIRGRF